MSAKARIESKRLRRLYDDSMAAAVAITNTEKKDAPEHRALRDVAAAILNLDAAFVR